MKPVAEAVSTIIADNWLSVLVAAIMAVFGGGGIAALIKTRNEGPKILVDAATGAVVVQSEVIEDLKEQNIEQKKAMAELKEEMRLQKEQSEAEIAELRTHLAELNSLRTRVRELEQKNVDLSAENNLMSAQIRALSRVVRDNEQKSEKHDYKK